jgi:uncharacterized damage-inducible protein DinB
MNYRTGAIGAMTDEYEKALNELKAVLNSISDDVFLKTNLEVATDFQSIRNITHHIIRSGYLYSNYVRKSFGMEVLNYEFTLHSVEEALIELDKMFQYKLETYHDRWLMTDDEMMKTIIKTSWTTYDLEAIIEHSIVHILRHRLQIQKQIEKQLP